MKTIKESNNLVEKQKNISLTNGAGTTGQLYGNKDKFLSVL